jgi:predicted nuclease of predicted toxin-antitoxin system
VKYLLDENTSPLVATALRTAGHDAVHVREEGLQRASDRVVLEAARSQQRVLLSGDTDFGQILASSGAPTSSAILLCHRSARDAGNQANLVLANLERVASHPDAGAIVVVEDLRVRVRRLPITEG